MKKFNKILQYPDPVLSRKSIDVKRIDNDILNLLNDLESLAKKNSKQGVVLIGLSAPQVGLNVRAFVFLDLKTDSFVKVVNPRIVYQTKEITAEWEGCASVGLGESSLFGPVKRSKSVQIEYTDILGKQKIITANNFQSHILLHEVDHLDGIMFLDRVEDPAMIMTAKELDDYARKHNGKHPRI